MIALQKDKSNPGYTFKTVYVWFSHIVSNLLVWWIYLKNILSLTVNVADLVFILLFSIFYYFLFSFLVALVDLFISFS